MARDLDRLQFGDDGLVACICQDVATADVLMLAWMSEESLEQTLETGRATFWSRSRQELWEKGATSGNVLEVVDLAADCDGDAVLARVRPLGPACHTGEETCFGARRAFPARLAAVIEERRDADATGSYTARLLGGPREHVARKVGEEAVETLLAAPASDALVSEIADLWFHSLVLLAHDRVDPLAPLRVLERRHARG